MSTQSALIKAASMGETFRISDLIQKGIHTRFLPPIYPPRIDSNSINNQTNLPSLPSICFYYKSKGEKVDVPDSKGMTPLHHAANGKANSLPFYKLITKELNEDDRIIAFN